MSTVPPLMSGIPEFGRMPNMGGANNFTNYLTTYLGGLGAAGPMLAMMLAKPLADHMGNVTNYLLGLITSLKFFLIMTVYPRFCDEWNYWVRSKEYLKCKYKNIDTTFDYVSNATTGSNGNGNLNETVATVLDWLTINVAALIKDEHCIRTQIVQIYNRDYEIPNVRDPILVNHRELFKRATLPNLDEYDPNCKIYIKWVVNSSKKEEKLTQTMSSGDGKSGNTTSEQVIHKNKVSIYIKIYCNSKINPFKEIEGFLDSLRILKESNTYKLFEKENQFIGAWFLNHRDQSNDSSASNCVVIEKLVTMKSMDKIFIPKKIKRDLLKTVDDLSAKNSIYDVLGLPKHLHILCSGHPGNGKTGLAKALALYTGRSIITVSMKNILSGEQFRQLLHNEMVKIVSKNPNIKNGQYRIPRDKIIFVFEETEEAFTGLSSRADKNAELRRLQDMLNELSAAVRNDVNTTDPELAKMIKHKQKVIDQLKKDIETLKEKDMESDGISIKDFLEIMDGMFEFQGLITYWTTNHPELINGVDPAVTRRFNLKINLEHMKIPEICEMIASVHKLTVDEVSKTLSLEHLNGEFSGAEWCEICKRMYHYDELCDWIRETQSKPEKIHDLKVELRSKYAVDQKQQIVQDTKKRMLKDLGIESESEPEPTKPTKIKKKSQNKSKKPKETKEPKKPKKKKSGNNSESESESDSEGDSDSNSESSSNSEQEDNGSGVGDKVEVTKEE